MLIDDMEFIRRTDKESGLSQIFTIWTVSDVLISAGYFKNIGEVRAALEDGPVQTNYSTYEVINQATPDDITTRDELSPEPVMAKRKQTITLTAKQIRILECVTAVQTQVARDILAHDPQAIPTEWVFAVKLKTAFKISKADLERLVKKGYLDIKPSDGFGPMVRRVEQP